MDQNITSQSTPLMFITVTSPPPPPPSVIPSSPSYMLITQWDFQYMQLEIVNLRAKLSQIDSDNLNKEREATEAFVLEREALLRQRQLDAQAIASLMMSTAQANEAQVAADLKYNELSQEVRGLMKAQEQLNLSNRKIAELEEKLMNSQQKLMESQQKLVDSQQNFNCEYMEMDQDQIQSLNDGERMQKHFEDIIFAMQKRLDEADGFQQTVMDWAKNSEELTLRIREYRSANTSADVEDEISIHQMDGDAFTVKSEDLDSDVDDLQRDEPDTEQEVEDLESEVDDFQTNYQDLQDNEDLGSQSDVSHENPQKAADTLREIEELRSKVDDLQKDYQETPMAVETDEDLDLSSEEETSEDYDLDCNDTHDYSLKESGDNDQVESINTQKEDQNLLIKVGKNKFVHATSSLFFTIDWTKHYSGNTKQLVCNKCLWISRCKNNMEDHVYVQHFNGKFKCPQCPSTFTWRTGVLGHSGKSHGRWVD